MTLATKKKASRAVADDIEYDDAEKEDIDNHPSVIAFKEAFREELSRIRGRLEDIEGDLDNYFSYDDGYYEFAFSGALSAKGCARLAKVKMLANLHSQEVVDMIWEVEDFISDSDFFWDSF